MSLLEDEVTRYVRAKTKGLPEGRGRIPSK